MNEKVDFYDFLKFPNWNRKIRKLFGLSGESLNSDLKNNNVMLKLYKK